MKCLNIYCAFSCQVIFCYEMLNFTDICYKSITCQDANTAVFLRIFGLCSAYGIYRVQMAYSRVYRVFVFVDGTILGTTRYICHVYIDVL